MTTTQLTTAVIKGNNHNCNDGNSYDGNKDSTTNNTTGVILALQPLSLTTNNNMSWTKVLVMDFTVTKLTPIISYGT